MNFSSVPWPTVSDDRTPSIRPNVFYGAASMAGALREVLYLAGLYPPLVKLPPDAVEVHRAARRIASTERIRTASRLAL